MDKIIEKKKWTKRKLIVFVILPSVLAIFLLYLVFSDNRARLKVESDQLVISTIKLDDFQEYIPVIGSVQYKDTRFIEAIQPGTIKKVYKESGNLVKKDDIIIELANPTLELTVITQESSLYYQLSTVRNSKLQLNQNELNQLSQLANYNYQINLSEPQYQRYKVMHEKNLISQMEFEQVSEQYLVNKRQRDLFLSSYRADSISRVDQLSQITLAENRMIESLKSVRQMLDALIIRAPIAGQLNSPDLKIGQTINAGQRIGQVNVLGDYTIRVNIDEHYLADIKTGQKGSFEFNGKNYTLVINKIFPTVTSNNFQVDMDFKGEFPKGIIFGQNLQIRLELGNLEKSLLLPAGAFYNKTGGSWVYVLDKNGKTAVKRNIKIGRKNPDNFEVLEGLTENERVITSSYDLLSNYDLLIIN
jgi:HlyD family secretion protein